MCVCVQLVVVDDCCRSVYENDEFDSKWELLSAIYCDRIKSDRIGGKLN